MLLICLCKQFANTLGLKLPVIPPPFNTLTPEMLFINLLLDST